MGLNPGVSEPTSLIAFMVDLCAGERLRGRNADLSTLLVVSIMCWLSAALSPSEQLWPTAIASQSLSINPQPLTLEVV